MHGLVITEPSAPESEILHAVFIDRNEERTELLFIKRPPPVNRRAMSKEERKYHDKREREKELLFGDWISFEENERDGKFILDYRKEFPFCESRVTAEHCQVKGVCVFAPSRSKVKKNCFTDIFGPIDVSAKVAQCFLPDVAISCWISIKVINLETTEFAFGEYIGIAEDQSSVLCTPWNQDSHRYFVEVFDSDGDDSDKESSRHKLQLNSAPFESRAISDTLNGMDGLRTGGHKVLCFEYPSVAFYLVYCPLREHTQMGDVLQFDAVYSSPLNAYLIVEYRKKTSIPSFGYRAINFGSLPALEMRAVRDGLPLGYFRVIDNKVAKCLGVLHDRRALLSPAMLNAPADTVFEVFVSDSGPNSFSRFSIEDASERTSKLLATCKEDEYQPLKDLVGITLGTGQVFVRDYAMLKFRFGNGSTENWEDLKAGTWIKFTATSEKGTPSFVIKKWFAIFEAIPEAVNYIFTDAEFMFQTACHYRNDLGVLESAAFGFVDDPDRICKRMKKGDPVTVWVKEGNSSSRTPFVVYSIEKPDSLQPSQRKVSEKIAPKISSTQENAVTMKINSVEHNDEAKSVDGELEKESKCSLQYCLLCEIMKSEYVQEALRRAAPDLYELAMDSVSEVH